MRGNNITSLMDGDTKLEDRESITKHIIDFFENLCSKEDRSCPSLDNLEFANIGEERADWLEKAFKEE